MTLDVSVLTVNGVAKMRQFMMSVRDAMKVITHIFLSSKITFYFI